MYLVTTSSQIMENRSSISYAFIAYDKVVIKVQFDNFINILLDKKQSCRNKNAYYEAHID